MPLRLDDGKVADAPGVIEKVPIGNDAVGANNCTSSYIVMQRACLARTAEASCGRRRKVNGEIALHADEVMPRSAAMWT